ncbi:MAG: hypothetical protein RL173_936 [Fibrobacterota bacterium]|jgi:very-short-patch-repair endonuclease
MSGPIEDRLYMVGDHFSRSGKMVWDNHFVGTHEMVNVANGSSRGPAYPVVYNEVGGQIPVVSKMETVGWDKEWGILDSPVDTQHSVLCAEEGVLRVYAKQMRSNQTEAETHLWQRLRAHRLDGLKFKRQKPIGRFIVDFVCHECALVVEVDGGYHAEQVEYDEARTAWLKSQGFQVLRFWNHEVLRQTESVLRRILEAASAPSPFPSPVGERHPLPQAGEGKGEGAQRQESNGGWG